MTLPLEYHIPVKRPIQRSFPASPAAILLLPLLLVSLSYAQHESASATSSTSGHAASAAASGATSYTHTSSAPGASSSKTSHPTNGSGHNNGHPRHDASTGVVYYPYVYGVPVPYAVDANDAGASKNDDADDDAEYQGGPTIFDRRGSGPDSYVPPSYEGPAHAQAQEDSSESPQIPTALVFKDGHQLEIENYAVVGQTLYDLTPGHSRKIALADLDLPATQKQNDDRGVTFQLPSSSQGN
jgi:hypothetical protein